MCQDIVVPVLTMHIPGDLLACHCKLPHLARNPISRRADAPLRIGLIAQCVPCAKAHQFCYYSFYTFRIDLAHNIL